MEELEDMELVRAYTQTGSEEAFATLVSRHLSFVYSTALREVRNSATAEDVSQAVFIVLAKKASSMGPGTILPAWLYRTTRYASADTITAEIRRQRRDLEVQMEHGNDENESIWRAISPLLDEALATLGEKDRTAIILRFLEERRLSEVGRMMGTGENTAGMRVARALEKLRGFFARRGVVLPAAVIAAAIAANSLQAAPADLPASVAVAAVKGSAATSSALAAVKGVLKIMAWTKLKASVAVGVAVLLAAGTATVTVKYVFRPREDPVWRHITGLDRTELADAPGAVSIRPTKKAAGVPTGFTAVDGKMLGMNNGLMRLLANAYGTRRDRVIAKTRLPTNNFDYIVSLPDHQKEALQAAIRKKFGLVGRYEARNTDVYVLTVARPNAPGLKPVLGTESQDIHRWSKGKLNIVDSAMDTLTWALEFELKEPVIDETGLDGLYDMDIEWPSGRLNPNPKEFTKAVLDRLGLQVTPAQRETKMLVVEKAK